MKFPGSFLAAFSLASAIALAAGFAACDDIEYGDQEILAAGDDDDTAGGDDDTDGTSGATPTWENFGQPFMQAYCVSCHGNPPTEDAPMPLVTYEDVEANLNNIVIWSVNSEAMPPSSADAFPTAQERATLGEWIDAGAPREQ
ncbi:hypothetical protein K8I61_13845 [bacterium]|nr:hypothetical protein [bacterium]